MDVATSIAFPRSSRMLRCSGALGILGGATWIASWILSGITEGGSQTVFGMAYWGWSRMLLPALVCSGACLLGFHARYTREAGRIGLAGFAITMLALVTMLCGGILNYCSEALGIPESVAGHGWPIIVVGFFLLPLGWILLGIARQEAGATFSWARALPLAFGTTMLLLFFQGILVMWLTGSGEQEAWSLMPLVVTGLGWIALGTVLCTDKGSRGRDPKEDGS